MAAHLGGIGVFTLGYLVGSAVFLAGMPEANAQSPFFFREAEPDGFPREAPQRPELRPRPAIKQSVRPAPKQAVKQKEAPTPPGPHLLVVSIKSQRVSLYSNGKLVMQSPISSGMPTHPTPTGVFSIIQKNRHHRSNIYSGAPMPYMQRLTWSGIALHQGALPGRPASHGCIRLPEQFASFLWRTTRLGARVVVSRDDIEPYDVTHAKLFQPKAVPTTVETAPPLRRTLDTTTPHFTRTAGITMVVTDASAARSGDDAAKPAEPTTTSAAPDAAAQDPVAPIGEPAPDNAKQEAAEPKPVDAQQPTGQESASTQTAEPAKPAPSFEAAKDITGSVYPQKADIPDAIIDSFAQSLQAKQKKSPPRGPISIFISRKEKQLYVRQGFIPLFTAPVSFRDEKAIFGTHVLTAYDKGGDSKELRWAALTLPAEPPHAAKSKSSLQIDASVHIAPAAKHTRSQAREHEQNAVPSIASVLDRIDIPEDVVERVSEYITAGASLIVSDHGLGNETGLYTDFIVETR